MSIANNKAFVIRAYPHGINRLKEFLLNDRVAIGWPGMGSLSKLNTRSEIKNILELNYGYSSHKLGNAGGQLHRFCNELKIGNYILVPNGSQIYIGIIRSDYKFDQTKDVNDEGWSHYRDIEWLFHKQPVDKSVLNGNVVASLKGQSSFFESSIEGIESFVNDNPNYSPNKLNNIDLIENYLKLLNTGSAIGINANTFEDMVCEILQLQFPTLHRLGTRNSAIGDTDLICNCIGNICIRIQVKYYMPGQGKIRPNVIKQLADSMDPGDIGFIASTTELSLDATETAIFYEKENKSISLISARQLVEILFENLDKFNGAQLRRWGIITVNY